MLRATLILLLACATVAQAETPSPELLAKLRQGGHVVFLRHAFADEGIDQDPKTLGPCTMQRRLSPKGRGQARAIGNAFATLGIPVGRVAVSPYCRAMETVAIAFGPMEVDHRLRLWQGELTDQEKLDLPIAVKRMLAATPRGGNTVLVSHNSKDALGIELDQGEAALVEPRGGEAFQVLLKIKPGEWNPASTVAADAARPDWIVAEYPLGGAPALMALAPNAGAALRLANGTDVQLDSYIGRTVTTRTRFPGPPKRAGPRSIDAPDGTRWQVSAGGAVSANGTGLSLPGGSVTVNNAIAAPDGSLWLSRPARNAVVLIRRP